MVILFHNVVGSGGKALVHAIHYMPEMLTEEEKAGGLLVDSELPRPAEEKGFSWVHYVNPTTLEQSYEKVPRPLSPEEQLDDLKAANATLNQRLAQTNADAVGFQEFIFKNFPELA